MVSVPLRFKNSKTVFYLLQRLSDSGLLKPEMAENKIVEEIESYFWFRADGSTFFYGDEVLDFDPIKDRTLAKFLARIYKNNSLDIELPSSALCGIYKSELIHPARLIDTDDLFEFGAITKHILENYSNPVTRKKAYPSDIIYNEAVADLLWLLFEYQLERANENVWEEKIEEKELDIKMQIEINHRAISEAEKIINKKNDSLSALKNFFRITHYNNTDFSVYADQQYNKYLQGIKRAQLQQKIYKCIAIGCMGLLLVGSVMGACCLVPILVPALVATSIIIQAAATVATSFATALPIMGIAFGFRKKIISWFNNLGQKPINKQSDKSTAWLGVKQTLKDIEQQKNIIVLHKISKNKYENKLKELQNIKNNYNNSLKKFTQSLEENNHISKVQETLPTSAQKFALLPQPVNQDIVNNSEIKADTSRRPK